MGITGLIPFLEKSSAKVHLNELRGSTVAVDTYCWLHKGVFSCAEKLVRGEDTDQYLQYCLKYVQMLLSYDIKPILVFDGRHLPAKELTERRRRESRKEAKKRAAELLRLGRVDEARSQMRRCVDVTHEMALRLIRECRLRNVDCIVAPYEADAQMAWLNKVDLAQYVITEDSDLTLFGARRVIFKLDLSGSGLLVEADKLYLSMGCREDKYNFDKFRRMCILSGCDYLDSLPGIGLAKACKFILKTEEDDMRRALKKIPSYLNMKNLEVPEEYIDGFLKAEATFRHMFIYNPLQRRQERLHDLVEYQTEESLCCNAGSLLDDTEQAMKLALGNLNPFTLKQLDNWHPDAPNSGFSNVAKGNKAKRAPHPSIWRSKSAEPAKPKESPAKKGVPSCALYFKKVDFITQRLDDDIRDSLKEELAKPEEAELYLMYKREGSFSSESQPKKPRCDSGSITPPRSPLANRAHANNPFAKSGQSVEKSPRVCASSSLLRVLSPQKSREQQQRQLTRVNSLKRSIFSSTATDDKSSAVEVKSRFFAANIKQATLKKHATAPDLGERIANAALEAQRKQSLLEELYKTESPVKQEDPSETQLTPTRLPSDMASYGDNSCDSLSSLSKCSGSLASSQADYDRPAVKTEPSETITLSDDSDSRHSAKSEQSRASPTIKMEVASVASRRVGLSKPKVAAKTSKKVAPVDSSQTKLSMFGFQKRPALK